MKKMTKAKGFQGNAGFAFLIAAGICLLCVQPLAAATVDLGGGWEAAWDASLDELVDVTNRVGGVVSTPVGDAIFVQKSAEFTQPQNPLTGLFNSIPITFTQNSPDAVRFIVIEDEIITNSTGSDWTDFHMLVQDGPDAFFRPDYTADPLLSGGPGPIGWTIDPFTQAAFSPDNKELDIWGGVVANGTKWFPGDGATNGNLWIEVNPTGSTTFILKETPTPEPATLGLLALGGLMLRRRRR